MRKSHRTKMKKNRFYLCFLLSLLSSSFILLCCCYRSIIYFVDWTESIQCILNSNISCITATELADAEIEWWQAQKSVWDWMKWKWEKDKYIWNSTVKILFALRLYVPDHIVTICMHSALSATRTLLLLLLLLLLIYAHRICLKHKRGTCTHCFHYRWL